MTLHENAVLDWMYGFVSCAAYRKLFTFNIPSFKLFRWCYNLNRYASGKLSLNCCDVITSYYITRVCTGKHSKEEEHYSAFTVHVFVQTKYEINKHCIARAYFCVVFPFIFSSVAFMLCWDILKHFASWTKVLEIQIRDTQVVWYGCMGHHDNPILIFLLC